MPEYIKFVSIILLILCVLFVITRNGLFSGKRPTDLGIKAGQLKPCPGTPNCVSTFAEDAQHNIYPFTLTSSPKIDQEKLLAIIKSLPRTNIVVNQPGYIYVEFQTAIMMFKDDVEFWFDEQSGNIHFRSASRLGSYDFGLNRRRMEELRRKYLQEQ